MKDCKQGIVANAVVPAITFCRLNIKNNYDDSRYNLGQYINGFWFQNNVFHKPFLKQSYTGEYQSPVLNGK